MKPIRLVSTLSLLAVPFFAPLAAEEPAHADTVNMQLAQKVLCTEVQGPSVLTPTDLTKTLPSVRTPLAQPLRAFFYGARACGQPGFTVDVHVTSALKLPAGTTQFDVSATAGGRNGKWEPNHQFLTVDELVTTECSGKQGQALTACWNAQMTDKCSRLVRVNTGSWKKSGWTAFKTYYSSSQGFYFDRTTMSCQPAPKVAGGPQPEYTPTPNDGFRKVPAAGQEDVYRLSTEVVLLRDAIVNAPADDPTADAAPGWSAYIAPSAHNGTNPPLMQFPVEVYVRGW